ncbi:MAG: DnaD domain protein, partial [Acutalibacteraceae bacterium]|nr:DnaD domain protein [Acutalibacteraceae bacterium]
RWTNEWKFGRDMLKAAYDECIDHTQKYSWQYINTILASWHKNGYKKVTDINEKPEKAQKESNKTSYSIDEIENMLFGGKKE